MKAIYDMMGKCTYPVLKEETPRQHVEVFFQAGVAPASSRSRSEDNLFICPAFCLQQKMDKNRDGVVTIDEFIDCCQNVRRPSRRAAAAATAGPAAPSRCCL